MIKRQQIHAARALLGWNRATLAARSDVAERTIARFEAGEGDITVGKLESLETALVEQGIEFIDGGVTLEELKRARARPVQG